MKAFLHITHHHLSLFITNDLQPYLNNHIKPVITTYINPILTTLTNHIHQDILNILHYTSPTPLKNTTSSTSSIAIPSQTNIQTTDLPHFWTYILLLPITAIVILASQLLSTQLWRGAARMYYTLTLTFKGIIARVWRWALWLAVVGVGIGVAWRIVIVKGEEHFGDIDNL